MKIVNFSIVIERYNFICLQSICRSISINIFRLSADSLNKIVLQNINLYPENYFNYGNLLSLVMRYKDREKWDALLEKLTAQYRGTMLGKFAEELRYSK